MTFKATPHALDFIDDVLRLFYLFPFSVKWRMLPRIIFGPNVPDTVPSVSFAEQPYFFREHLPYVHFLDTENKFANFEAWYGAWENIVFFEIEPHILDGDGKDALEQLYEGERKFATGQGLDEAERQTEFQFRDHTQVLRRAQKPLSPRRPVIEHYRGPQDRLVSHDGYT